MRKPRIFLAPGSKVGKLTLIKQSGVVFTQGKKKANKLFLCKCECETLIDRNAEYLRHMKGRAACPGCNHGKYSLSFKKFRGAA